MIDAGGSRASDAQESYWHRSTGGSYPPADLARGQALLLDLGLLREDEGTLHPTFDLAELLAGSADDALVAFLLRLGARDPQLVAPLDEEAFVDLLPDVERREELLLQLAQRHEDDRNAAIGDVGERMVVAAARTELAQLGRADLARDVRRVSLVSDQLGYDVRAPRLQGPPRRLEVKSTTSIAQHVEVFISRSEADTGRKTDGWNLVVCHVGNVDRAEGTIVGWWSYGGLADRLPRDVDSGSWQQARLTLRVSDAHPGLPSAAL